MLIIQFYFHSSLVTAKKSVKLLCPPQCNLLYMFSTSGNDLAYNSITHTCVCNNMGFPDIVTIPIFPKGKEQLIYWMPNNMLYSTGLYMYVYNLIPSVTLEDRD